MDYQRQNAQGREACESVPKCTFCVRKKERLAKLKSVTYKRLTLCIEGPADS